MQTERRKHPRIKPDSLFRVTSHTADFADDVLHRANLALRCLDLSARGACIVTPGRLRVGASLVLAIDVPDTTTRFRGKAVVRWSQTLERQGREAHLAGLEILQVLECQGERVAFLSQGARNLLPADTRQKHRRVLVNEAEVSCVAAGLLASLGMSGNLARSLVDMSEGGCQLVLLKKMEIGRCVNLRFSFRHPAVQLEAVGLVKRCDRDTLSLAPKYLTGIQFETLSNEAAARLQLVLKALVE